MKARDRMPPNTRKNGQEDDGRHGVHLVKSTAKGWGIYARKLYRPGQILGFFGGYPVNEDTRNSLTLDGLKIEPTGDLKFLNHSCSPNAAFRGRWLVTVNRIMPGEELTIDYLATERTISHHFVCKCGSETCRGTI
jgi:hypothetical protein